MRSWRKATTAVVLGLTAALGAGAPRAEARGTLVLKRFLVGHLEANTHNFFATGGRGTTEAFRDNVLMFVFTAPLDLDTLDDRTVQIGIPTGPGLRIRAEGTFYGYSVNEFDPISGAYVTKRTYRNRVLFDPTSRYEADIFRNPAGFRADSTYTVAIPGVDKGALKTVKSADGTPLRATFTTTFATTDKFAQGALWCPGDDPK
jgi:hypothetical protein